MTVELYRVGNTSSACWVAAHSEEEAKQFYFDNTSTRSFDNVKVGMTHPTWREVHPHQGAQGRGVEEVEAAAPCFVAYQIQTHSFLDLIQSKNAPKDPNLPRWIVAGKQQAEDTYPLVH